MDESWAALGLCNICRVCETVVMDGGLGEGRLPVRINMLATAALDYVLPEELIAMSPVSPRDSARLMVLKRSDPSYVEHVHVRDLPGVLGPRDLLVVNTTRVLPARFRAVRADSGGRGEGLFIAERSVGTSESGTGLVWQVLLKMRRVKPGVEVNLELNTPSGGRSGVWLKLIERVTRGDDAARAGASDEGADGWLVAVVHDRSLDGQATTKMVLDRVGLPPLPPYILASRKRHELAMEDARDRETYQTVYAAGGKDESHGSGSVAAPTAGLHFTPELLARLSAAGVARAEVVLHVGMGTFKPVETEFVEQHAMHAEWCSVPGETVRAMSGDEARRVVAVGTTTARTLESYASLEEMRSHPERSTRILITPGYHFKHVGALMTNFHLPRSTLMAMVGAFMDDDDSARGAGLERLIGAYRVAIEMKYRFYSFGDAMLIVP